MTEYRKLTRVELANEGLRNPTGGPKFSWLDKIVAEQAAYYGTTPEKLEVYMRAVAETQVAIEQGLIDEPVFKFDNIGARGQGISS